MFRRKHKARKVVHTWAYVQGNKVIPIYLLDDGSVVWKLSDKESAS